MIFLALFAFLPLPSTAEPFRDHLSENLQLKCACLPYRTTFVDNRCYIAVQREIEYNKAATECSSIFSGAKVSTDDPDSIFNTMMVDKSKFHTGSAFSGAKQILCSYGSDYKCDAAETKLSNGRCVVRAPKKMNFVDAKNYCEKRGMELPALANDLDNRIVREVLVKDPAWVDKSLARDNGFKWKQGKTYSRWTTCDRPTGNDPRLYAGHQNRLRTCTKDTASVIDRTGYWSTGGVELLMDVVCIKSAENIFTNAPSSLCNYHEANVEEYPPVTGDACLTANSKTCYTLTKTTKKYEILGKATVETRRACEVLCDSEASCTGISFKEGSNESSCIMLSSATNEIFNAPTTIFLKQTTGCVARSNLTAEFGVDPCIDEMATSAFQGFDRKLHVNFNWNLLHYTICETLPDKMYIVRAIDACGRRFTIDNDVWNWIEAAGDKWNFRRIDHDGVGRTTIPIVAASCVLAGDKKCPCKTPLRTLPNIPQPTYPVTMNRQNPCNGGNSQLWMDVARRPTYIWYTVAHKAMIFCKAGTWMVYGDNGKRYMWGVTGAACYN